MNINLKISVQWVGDNNLNNILNNNVYKIASTDIENVLPDIFEENLMHVRI